MSRAPAARIGQVWEPLERGLPFAKDKAGQRDLPAGHPPWAGRLLVAGAAIVAGEKWPDGPLDPAWDGWGENPPTRREAIYRIEPYLVLRLLGVSIFGTPYVLQMTEPPLRKRYRCIYDPAPYGAPTRPHKAHRTTTGDVPQLALWA